MESVKNRDTFCAAEGMICACVYERERERERGEIQGVYIDTENTQANVLTKEKGSKLYKVGGGSFI